MERRSDDVALGKSAPPIMENRALAEGAYGVGCAVVCVLGDGGVERKEGKGKVLTTFEADVVQLYSHSKNG